MMNYLGDHDCHKEGCSVESCAFEARYQELRLAEAELADFTYESANPASLLSLEEARAGAENARARIEEITESLGWEVKA
jgi:capsule polysaccharide export protein KpsE/RkpR